MFVRKGWESRQVRRCSGFTLIELLVVLAIIALLLTVALPRYFTSLEKSKEITLQQDLKVLRDTVDKFYADHGRYPDSLGQLVTEKYLREIPVDPVTDSAQTWIVQPPQNRDQGAVYDVHSGAAGNSRSGRPFAEL